MVDGAVWSEPTRKLTVQEIERLHDATRATLIEWTERLRAESAGAFPEKVTAFRPGMAVHDRYGQPCSEQGAARIAARAATSSGHATVMVVN